MPRPVSDRARACAVSATAARPSRTSRAPRARRRASALSGRRCPRCSPRACRAGTARDRLPRSRRELVDERLERERHLRTVRVAQVAGAQRRLPDHRQRDDVRRHALIRNAVLDRRRFGAAGGRRLAPPAHELRDQHRVGLVVAQMVVVDGARVVLERRQLALRVEPAAQLEDVGRALRVPGRLLVPHPLHAHRPAELVREERGFEADVVGGRAAVDLRPIHVDDAHALARQSEELRDAVAQAVRLHVVRVDRHLTVGRIGQRVRRADRRVPLERHFVLGLDDARGARERRIGVARDARLLARRRRRAADVVEQLGRTPGTAPARAASIRLSAAARRRWPAPRARRPRPRSCRCSRRARSPDMLATDDSSMLRSVAPANGGRTLRACSMPGTFMSTAQVNDPSTLPGMS